MAGSKKKVVKKKVVNKKKVVKKKVATKKPTTKWPIHCSFDKLVDVSKLKPHPDNPNEHSEQQLDVAVKVMSANGWRSPVVVSKQSGFITRGHGRRKAAIKGGEKFVPVDFQDYDDDDMELADVVADNEIQKHSFFDRGMLRDVLGDIDAHPVDIEVTGFVRVEVEHLFGAAPPTGATDGEQNGSSGSSSGESGSKSGSKTGEPGGGTTVGEDPGAPEDVIFEFGDYKGRLQTCLFDDFELKYEEARETHGFVTLDDTLRFLVGL